MFPFPLTFFITHFKTIAVGLVLAIFVGGAYIKGRRDVQAAWDLQTAITNQEIANLKAKQSEKTVEVVTQYVDRVKIVKEKADVITKYVDRWITKEDDIAYRLPGKFRVLHDWAAAGVVPETPRSVDEKAADVELSTTTRTISENYGICRQNAQQLISLQDWVSEQYKLNPPEPK